MLEKLVVLSDMWGIKKGSWITSYLGNLQQDYNIEFYDCLQLSNIDIPVLSEENLHQAYVNGGIDTAAAHLLKKETEESHYLAFSTGGTVVWKAALNGLPIKSLTAISATRIRYEDKKPDCDITLLYGGKDEFMPKKKWFDELDVVPAIEPNFGHQLYSDEKIIEKVCGGLLEKVTEEAGN